MTVPLLFGRGHPLSCGNGRRNMYFHENFIENDFGHVCNICDQLWFMKDVRRVSEKMVNMLAVEFPYENVKDFKVCAN